MPTTRGAVLRDMYERLFAAYGPQHWWPADSCSEVVIGAILTQNTAWKNVERAMANLKSSNLINWTRLHSIPDDELAEVIRPAGTFRVKAGRIKAFANHLGRHYGGQLDRFLRMPGDRRSTWDVTRKALATKREELLSIPGIGPETADAILLYAGGLPLFVVDAYALRILRRHKLVSRDATYDEAQRLFHRSLNRDPALFNEYHALLVAVGKRHCRKQARCTGCPLSDLPHDENE